MRLADYLVVSRAATPLERAPENGERQHKSATEDKSGLHWPRVFHDAECFLPPLVDICVVFPTRGEKVPLGYKCLSRTPFGYKGDCNSGVVGSDPVFICARYGAATNSAGRLLRPIVDVIVVSVEKEPVPQGYDLIQRSHSGASSANLNGGYLQQTILLAIRRSPKKPQAHERYNSTRPIVDLCMINQSKNEPIPLGFECTDKSTSSGNWTGSKMLLCFRRGAGRGMLDVKLRVGFADRVPREDWPDFPLPAEFALFTAPNGLELKRCEETNQPLPEFFSMELTTNDGSRLFANCLTFYEIIPDNVAFELECMYDEFLSSTSFVDTVLQRQRAASVLEEDNEMVIFAPVRLTLLSRHPLTRQFKRFLMLLYEVSISRSSFPLERLISKFMFGLPVPRPGRAGFTFLMGSEAHSINFSLPNASALPACPANFGVLLRCLSPKVIADFLALLLLEKRVLVHCTYLSVLNQVAQCVRALMFPLDWQGIFIPICPRSLSNVLDAPMPYVVGLGSDAVNELYGTLTSDIWEVDLDRGEIFYLDVLESATTISAQGLLQSEYGADPINPQQVVRTYVKPSPAIPGSLVKAFTQDLYDAISIFSQYLGPSPGKGALESFELQDPNMAYSLSPLEASGEDVLGHLEMRVRGAAAQVMTGLIGPYRDFLLPPRHALHGIGPSSNMQTNLANIFNVEDFLLATNKHHRTFMTRLVNTQPFTKFIDERTFSTELSQKFMVFDELVAASRRPQAQSSTPEPRTSSRKTHSRSDRSESSKKRSFGMSRLLARGGTKSLPARSKGDLTLLETVLANLGASARDSSDQPRKTYEVDTSLQGPTHIHTYEKFPHLNDELLDSPLKRHLDVLQPAHGVSRARASSLPAWSSLRDENGYAAVTGQSGGGFHHKRDQSSFCKINGETLVRMEAAQQVSFSAALSSSSSCAPLTENASHSQGSPTKPVVLKKSHSAVFSRPAFDSAPLAARVRTDSQELAAHHMRHAGVRVGEELSRSKLEAEFAFRELTTGIPRARACLAEVVGCWLTLMAAMLPDHARPELFTAQMLKSVSWLEAAHGLTLDEAGCRALLSMCARCGPAYASDANTAFYGLLERGGKPNAITYGLFTQALALRERPRQRKELRALIWRRLFSLLSAIAAFQRAGSGALPVLPRSSLDSSPGESRVGTIQLWSMTKCANCKNSLLDTQIMRGWDNSDEQLAILCPLCDFMVVPRLSFDHGGGPYFKGKCEYMSPIVLRRSFERLIQSRTDETPITLRWIRSQSPAVLYNLLWFIERLGLPNPLINAQRTKVHCSWQPLLPGFSSLSQHQSVSRRERTDLNSLSPSSSPSKGVFSQDPTYRIAQVSPERPLERKSFWGSALLPHLLACESSPDSNSSQDSWTPSKVCQGVIGFFGRNDFFQAVKLFFAARMASRSEIELPNFKLLEDESSYVCEGWEPFNNSAYIELWALAKLSSWTPRKTGQHELEFEQALIRAFDELPREDLTLASYLAPSDRPPPMDALAFRTVFPALFP